MKARALTTDAIFGVVPIALVVAIWQALVSFGYAPVTLLPPPGLVFARLAQQLVTGTFQQEIAATLFRLFAGFAIAVVLGVTIGLVTAARTFQAVDMFVPLITISLLGLMLNGALEALRAFLLRGFPEV